MPPILRDLADSRYHDRLLELIEEARAARKRAYARYSGFLVGAAVLADNGRIFAGVNVEGVDYDVTHAEESAISAMRFGTSARPVAIVAVGAKSDAVRPMDAPVVSPCGKCRQKIYEWILGAPDADIDVIVADPMSGLPRVCSIREILPLSFGG